MILSSKSLDLNRYTNMRFFKIQIKSHVMDKSLSLGGMTAGANEGGGLTMAARCATFRKTIYMLCILMRTFSKLTGLCSRGR